MMEQPRSVEFFFDPICPWAYQTSLWIREVRARTGLRVDWRFFSLEEINLEEGKKHPWEREWSYGWSLMRVGAYLRRQDPALLDRWYLTVGRAFHERGELAFQRETAERLLSDAGLPSDAVAAALADPTTHDDVKADHDRLVSAHAGYGVPTLVFPDGQALFGPVITPAPMGDAALRLWDLVAGWPEFPHLYELRRPKTAEDRRHIEDTFAPYARARQWRTYAKPVD